MLKYAIFFTIETSLTKISKLQWDDDSVYDFKNCAHGYYEYKNNGDIEDSEGNVLGNGTVVITIMIMEKLLMTHTISGSYT